MGFFAKRLTMSSPSWPWPLT